MPSICVLERPHQYPITQATPVPDARGLLVGWIG
jgi:hypothetical protein